MTQRSEESGAPVWLLVLLLLGVQVWGLVRTEQLALASSPPGHPSTPPFHPWVRVKPDSETGEVERYVNLLEAQTVVFSLNGSSGSISLGGTSGGEGDIAHAADIARVRQWVESLPEEWVRVSKSSDCRLVNLRYVNLTHVGDIRVGRNFAACGQDTPRDHVFLYSAEDRGHSLYNTCYLGDVVDPAVVYRLIGKVLDTAEP